jgi:hypothetical protein
MSDAARVWQSRIFDQRKEYPTRPCMNLLSTSSRPSVLLNGHELCISRSCMYSSIPLLTLVNLKNITSLSYRMPTGCVHTSPCTAHPVMVMSLDSFCNTSNYKVSHAYRMAFPQIHISPNHLTRAKTLMAESVHYIKATCLILGRATLSSRTFYKLSSIYLGTRPHVR